MQKNNESALLHLYQFFLQSLKMGPQIGVELVENILRVGLVLIEASYLRKSVRSIDYRDGLQQQMIVIGQRRSKRAFFSNFRTDRKMPDLWASERKIFFFLLFTGLVLVENYITCQAGLSPIKPFHNLRTLLSQNRNKTSTTLLNPESNRFSLKCKFAINDYSVNTSLFFGGKFEVKFEILSCWQRSNRHPILHYHPVAVQRFSGCTQKSQWH